ncbi:hypothetical protein [Flammeovirga kamogawensis]|uniref:DUF4331 domain-containing protein n=1 Tax=Flammeovirga kamogawensis TaxID=373891 RepID=A0ABX8GZ45_9BACT|nr:hypothetical protein [Flammeovirga kamogawensis]MBB6460864.1 hypothetical protein [Flammeovirga kamogawensis]QWG08210.1 hypothetical protein KM029_04540 [Flammeovirga kamogawensis]TRX70014.1 hypothetical protein EO216_18480 [Flammeovirga kamogawensis]
MKLLWKVSLLIGLTVLCFSCKDDDDDPSLKDANPIYFASDGEVEIDDVGDVYLQLSFDHSAKTVRIVARTAETGSAPNIIPALVLDITQNITTVSKSDDYKYTINVDKGATYTTSFKVATGCIPSTIDPGFSAGQAPASFVIEDFVEWDNSQGKYYMDASKVIDLLQGIDPNYGNGGDPGFSNTPKFWQSTGSIKGCEEMPTTFN